MNFVRLRFVMLVMLGLAAAACHPQGSGEEPGAPTARAAVEMFLAGARAQDMRAMSNVFGNERGLVRDDESQRDHEMRMLTLMCFLNHDTARILSETPGETRRYVVVELSRGSVRKQPTFTTVATPRNRWLVSEFPLEELQELCRNPTSRPPAVRNPGTR